MASLSSEPLRLEYMNLLYFLMHRHLGFRIVGS